MLILRLYPDDCCSILFVLVLFMMLVGAPHMMAEDIAPVLPCTIQNPSLFDHAQIPETFRPIITKLLALSPTFRRQCERIVTSRDLRLVVRMTMPILSFPVRSTVQRTRAGWWNALIDLTPASRLRAEDIAHEFEHVIERLDGIDVRELARRGMGAHEVQPGIFETERALRAGRLVAREAWIGRGAAASLSRATE